jgi:hypothetical protein
MGRQELNMVSALKSRGSAYPALVAGWLNPALLTFILCGCAHTGPTTQAPVSAAPLTAGSALSQAEQGQTKSIEYLSNWRQFKPVPELYIPPPARPLIPDRKLPVPSAGHSKESLVVLPGPRGAIDSATGLFYPSTPAGLLNPSTGQIYPRIGQGFINPSTGQYFRAPAGSLSVPR